MYSHRKRGVATIPMILGSRLRKLILQLDFNGNYMKLQHELCLAKWSSAIRAFIVFLCLLYNLYTNIVHIYTHMVSPEYHIISYFLCNRVYCFGCIFLAHMLAFSHIQIEILTCGSKRVGKNLEVALANPRLKKHYVEHTCIYIWSYINIQFRVLYPIPWIMNWKYGNRTSTRANLRISKSNGII